MLHSLNVTAQKGFLHAPTPLNPFLSSECVPITVAAHKGMSQYKSNPWTERLYATLLQKENISLLLSSTYT